MTESPVAQRSSAFRRRITLALAALATIAALQGGFAVWAVGLAQHHVLRGRVAADIKQGFTALWFDKQQLRNWMAQRQFGASTSDDQRDLLLQRMRDTLERLNGLAEQAMLLDDGPAARQRQAQRRDALTVLRGSLDQLARGLASLNQPAPGLDTGAAWRLANDLFDNAEGRDLRVLLGDSLAREDVSLREKRADTDATLAWLRRLWIATTASLVLAALVLAAGFTRALRAPLLALAEGAAALREGRLTHRIPLDASNEFGEVARSMNAMAEELAAHRVREAEARQALEVQVARRTAELTVALNTQKEAEARRRQLFADVSHELRTPTTAIRGEAQVALRGAEKPAEEYRQSLRRIEDATRQLGSTIDDLLTMARSDIDSLSLRHKPVDLGRVLEEVVSLGTAMAQARGIHLQARRWPSGLSMLGDEDRLRQILLVLLDNAIRYSHAGGVVQLAAQRGSEEPPTVELSIRDQGIGIAPDALQEVFERGFRAPNAQDHITDGSGLGLPIARMLARGHGGEVRLTSILGEGTVAIVTLPLAPVGEAS
ncbi:MAG: ATP-binding protein [Beijerinckiaceae bacterium]|nr:ATP-binding protein [Beijerinckiaceae bacterium]